MADDGDPLIPGTEVRYLRSEHVGDEFRIWIGHCGSEEVPGSGVLSGRPHTLP
jgi:hypothetical protein